MSAPEPVTGPVIVRLPTEIDMANTKAVAEQLCSAFTPGVAIVVADMTATVFCDSSGISALVTAHRCAQGQAAQLRLAVPSGQVRRVFSVTGLDQVLAIYPSRAAALDGEPTPSASGDPMADLAVRHQAIPWREPRSRCGNFPLP